MCFQPPSYHHRQGSANNLILKEKQESRYDKKSKLDHFRHSVKSTQWTESVTVSHRHKHFLSFGSFSKLKKFRNVNAFLKMLFRNLNSQHLWFFYNLNTRQLSGSLWAKVSEVTLRPLSFPTLRSLRGHSEFAGLISVKDSEATVPSWFPYYLLSPVWISRNQRKKS